MAMSIGICIGTFSGLLNLVKWVGLPVSNTYNFISTSPLAVLSCNNIVNNWLLCEAGDTKSLFWYSTGTWCVCLECVVLVCVVLVCVVHVWCVVCV